MLNLSHPSGEVAGELPENITGQHSDHALVPRKYKYSNVWHFWKNNYQVTKSGASSLVEPDNRDLLTNTEKYKKKVIDIQLALQGSGLS